MPRFVIRIEERISLLFLFTLGLIPLLYVLAPFSQVSKLFYIVNRMINTGGLLYGFDFWYFSWTSGVDDSHCLRRGDFFSVHNLATIVMPGSFVVFFLELMKLVFFTKIQYDKLVEIRILEGFLWTLRDDIIADTPLCCFPRALPVRQAFAIRVK